MSAAVESMAFARGEVPWHGLGVEIPDTARYSVSEGLKLSGLDWDVETVPVYLKTDNVYKESKTAMCVRRCTDNQELGVVGKRYHPLQNTVAFKWFQPMFESKLCALDTAGSLHDGEKIWILAEIMGAKPLEIAKNDYVRRFLLLSNSHDGTNAVRVALTPIRVVCANTLAMAHSKSNAANKFIRIRHSSQVEANLEAVRDIINLANNEFEATAEQYRFLASRHFNADDLTKYVKIMTECEDTAEEDISTRKKNTITEIVTKIVKGRGNDNPAIKNSWWAAMNGVTEWLNWDRGNTPSSRIDSLWYGKSQTDNLKAFKVALELANAA